MAKQSKGYCKYCGKEYTRSGMLKHLASCKIRQERLKEENTKTKCGYFQMVIFGKYCKDYWLIIEISEDSKLKDLDQFLRDIWLECCGHLSAFYINGQSYEAMPAKDTFWGKTSKSMNYKIKNVFSVGDELAYEYDFGSTTELILKVNGYRTGENENDEIIILSRNNPPEIMCSNCGKNKAQWTEVEDYGYWCKECLDKEMGGENEDELFLLPVCNSPRMGVCGYEGSEYYPDQFKPDKH